MNKSQRKQEILTIQKKLVGKWVNFFYLIYWLSAIITFTSLLFYPLNLNSPLIEIILFLTKFLFPVLLIVGSIDIYSLYLAKQAWIKQQSVK